MCSSNVYHYSKILVDLAVRDYFMTVLEKENLLEVSAQGQTFPF